MAYYNEDMKLHLGEGARGVMVELTLSKATPEFPHTFDQLYLCKECDIHQNHTRSTDECWVRLRKELNNIRQSTDLTYISNLLD